MNENEEPGSVLVEAGLLGVAVGRGRALLAAADAQSPVLDGLAKMVTGLTERAAAVENGALVAASETLDPVRFGRRVRARRAMQALRKRRRRASRTRRVAAPEKGRDLFPPPPPTEPLSVEPVPTRVVRRG